MRCLISLGANTGDRWSTLKVALQALQELPSTNVVSVSSVYASPPWGGPLGQGDFLNAAALLDTDLDPWELLQRTTDIERECGRQWTVRWGERPLDLDLLWMAGRVVQERQLQVPHPRLIVRQFALRPAAELAPLAQHQLVGRSLRELLLRLDTRPRVFAWAGFSDRQVERWTRELASRMPRGSCERVAAWPRAPQTHRVPSGTARDGRMGEPECVLIARAWRPEIAPEATAVLVPPRLSDPPEEEPSESPVPYATQALPPGPFVPLGAEGLEESWAHLCASDPRHCQRLPDPL